MKTSTALIIVGVAIVGWFIWSELRAARAAADAAASAANRKRGFFEQIGFAGDAVTETIGGIRDWAKSAVGGG